MTTPEHPERAPAIAVDTSRSYPDVAQALTPPPRTPVEADAPAEATPTQELQEFATGLVREIATLATALGDPDEWDEADDSTLAAEFDPWEVLRKAAARVSQLEATVAGISDLDEALRTMRAESDEALGYLAGKCHHATTVRPILRYIAALTAEHTARLAAEQRVEELEEQLRTANAGG